MKDPRCPNLRTPFLLVFLMGLGAIALFSPPATGEHAGTPTAVAAELPGLRQALLDAVASGDVAVWDRLLDEYAI
jgi:hypothetical protein